MCPDVPLVAVGGALPTPGGARMNAQPTGVAAAGGPCDASRVSRPGSVILRGAWAAEALRLPCPFGSNLRPLNLACRIAPVPLGYCCSQPKPAFGSPAPHADSRHRGPAYIAVSPSRPVTAPKRDELTQCVADSLEPFRWILPNLCGWHLHPLVPSADLAVSSPAALANRRGPCPLAAPAFAFAALFRDESKPGVP